MDDKKDLNAEVLVDELPKGFKPSYDMDGHDVIGWKSVKCLSCNGEARLLLKKGGDIYHYCNDCTDMWFVKLIS